MREETLAIVRRMQDNEATDQRVYAALAKQASLQKNSEILEKMSHDEGLHCAVWGRYTGIEAKADMFRVWLFVVLGKIFGLVFVINLMEEREKTTLRKITGSSWRNCPKPGASWKTRPATRRSSRP